MGLARSLGLWLACITALVLGAHGFMQVGQERQELFRAAQAELALLTTAVRNGIEIAVRAEQRVDIETMLEQLELRDPAVDVFVFGQDRQLVASSKGSEPNARRASDLARTVAEGMRVEGIPEVGLAAVAPVRAHERVIGRLVVIRPTGTLQADLDGERRAVLVSIVVLIAALSFVNWLVLRQRLHAPMRHLIAGIRRLATGDLSSRMAMQGRDEVAEIAREFDAMAGALDEARRRLATETEKHERLELEMQRANKLASVGELAAMLAHEIGSPLQVVSGRASALAHRVDLPKDASHSAAILVEQTDRIDRIVQRLLDVARRKASVLTEVDVREPVRLVSDLLAGDAQRRGVRFDLDFAEVPKVRADADHVQQVMLNLLQNALKASARGGVVRITIAGSSFSTAMAATERASVAIAVRDSGAGIPEEILDQIFEPFFTAWDHGQGVNGTGLGLPVVESIMTEHGGVVRVDPGRDGSGACFTVHFPVGATGPAAAEAS